MKIGQRVYWTDPDNDLASGEGVITEIQTPDGVIYEDTIIAIDKDDGGFVEALPHECRVIE